MDDFELAELVFMCGGGEGEDAEAECREAWDCERGQATHDAILSSIGGGADTPAAPRRIPRWV
jgi:hypothetical protein